MLCVQWFVVYVELVFIDCATLYAAGQICNKLDQASVKLFHYILPNIHVSDGTYKMAVTTNLYSPNVLISVW